jgi:hypothetical protein
MTAIITISARERECLAKFPDIGRRMAIFCTDTLGVMRPEYLLTECQIQDYEDKHRMEEWNQLSFGRWC